MSFQGIVLDLICHLIRLAILSMHRYSFFIHFRGTLEFILILLVLYAYFHYIFTCGFRKGVVHLYSNLLSLVKVAKLEKCLFDCILESINRGTI